LIIWFYCDVTMTLLRSQSITHFNVKGLGRSKAKQFGKQKKFARMLKKIWF